MAGAPVVQQTKNPLGRRPGHQRWLAAPGDLADRCPSQYIQEAEQAQRAAQSQAQDREGQGASAAKVEHPFRVVKRQFGYVKARFRGWVKNTTQLVTLCALSNLWMAHRQGRRQYQQLNPVRQPQRGRRRLRLASPAAKPCGLPAGKCDG